MKITNVSIVGSSKYAEEGMHEGKLIKLVDGKYDTVFLRNTFNRQRIKLTEFVSNSKKLTISNGDLIETPHTVRRDYVIEIPGSTKIMPGLNDRSFNPYLWKLSKAADSKIDQMNLIYFTVDTNTFKSLRYHTDFDIISTFVSRKNNQLGCLVRYPEVCDPSAHFTIYGITNRDRVVKISFTPCSESGVAITDTTTMNEKTLKTMVNVSKKFKNPMTFKYHSEEIPRKAICTVSGEEEMNKIMESLFGTDQYECIVFPDDTDFTSAEVAETFKDEISGSKGLIKSDKLNVSYLFARGLGVFYVFNAKYTDDDDHKIVTELAKLN